MDFPLQILVSSMPEKDDSDPFLKCFETLKEVVTPSKARSRVSRSASSVAVVASLQADLKQQVEQRQSLDNALRAAFQHRKAALRELDTIHDKSQQLSRSCTELQEQIESETMHHVGAIQQEQNKYREAVQAKMVANEVLGSVEARAVGMELHVNELQAELGQKEKLVEQLRESHRSDEQTQHRILETLQSDLEEVRARRIYYGARTWRASHFCQTLYILFSGKDPITANTRKRLYTDYIANTNETYSTRQRCGCNTDSFHARETRNKEEPKE